MCVQKDGPRFVTVLVEVRLRDNTERRRRVSIAEPLLDELKRLLASNVDIREATVWTQAFKTHKSYAEDFDPKHLEEMMAQLRAGEHIDLSGGEEITDNA